MLNDTSFAANSEELKETLLIYNSETDIKYEEYSYIYLGGEKTYYDTVPDTLGRNWFIYRKGQKVYVNDPAISGTADTNAKEYWKNQTLTTSTNTFTSWVKNKLGNITVGDLVLDNDVRDRNKDSIYGYGDTSASMKIFNCNFEDENSIFNIHKNDMIRVSIKENLSSAIANYSLHATSTYTAFQMPTLKEEEWNQITKNINMVAFVQGLPVGFKTYNNYAVITNTRNKDFVNQDSLVFIDANNPNSEYHMIDCDKLTGSNIQGYRKIDFEPSATEVVTSGGTGGSQRVTRYYYKHKNLPCYYCIVSKNYTKQAITGSRLTALKHALGRERQMLHY